MGDKHQPQHEHEHQHHLTPLTVYVKVFVGLIILTAITVGTSMFDFGIMNIVIALAIAIMKASLVILFFMQLKYDDLGNKVAFAASFGFLLIFILLTGSDLFFRHDPTPVQAQEQKAAGAGAVDQNKLRIATPELVNKGRDIFKVQCATCHGPEGKGNGVAAAALNPKPRDFTSGYWKFGGAPTRVFHTISTGSPGTAMASFAGLAVEDRYALAHYVRSLSPNHPDDTPEDLKAAGLTGEGKGGTAEKVQQEIPVEVAMEKMEEPDVVVIPETQEKNPSHPGAALFRNHCVQCHGLNGTGATTSPVGVNPPVMLMTRSFMAMAKASWATNETEFMKIVSQGTPGRGMPGFSDFTKQEWSALYSYVKGLTGP